MCLAGVGVDDDTAAVVWLCDDDTEFGSCGRHTHRDGCMYVPGILAQMLPCNVDEAEDWGLEMWLDVAALASS